MKQVFHRIEIRDWILANGAMTHGIIRSLDCTKSKLHKSYVVGVMTTACIELLDIYLVSDCFDIPVLRRIG